MATTSKEIGTVINPVTLSVIWNRLLTITRECGERVVHSAQSYVMGRARDLGPVLLTPDGKIVTSVEFLPCHCLLAEIPTKAILNKFGRLDPGDLVLANDAHIIQSGHLPDWTYFMPIYYKDELVYYTHFRGHAHDSGGALSGSYFPRAYDCIAEGLNIPPIKIMKKGAPNEEVREVIFDNIRTPKAAWADLELIYGSITKVQDDICSMIDKYGLDTLRACTDEMIKRDELATREQIRLIPDGVYYGESAVDWDGTTPDKQVWVRVKLTVEDDEMTFDFTESDDQVDFVNSPLGNTYAFVYNAIFLTLDPSIPHNHGARIPVHIVCREGSVVYPTRPHTYGSCACSCGCEIYEACAQALAKAVPDRAQAPAHRHFSVDLAGRLPLTDPRTGRDLEFFGGPFIEEGGSGGVKGYDGWDGMTGSILLGVIKRGSVEETELDFPLRFDKAQIEPDSEGAGEFRGSRGTYSERVCTMPKGGTMINMSGDCDGQTYPPHGVAGAPPASLSEMYMVRNGKKEIFKTFDMGPMFGGDVLIERAMGGAGWGSPFNRDPEKIRLEVRDGFLTPSRAKSVYGVVVTQKDEDNPESIEVDMLATEALRKKLRTKPVYRDVEDVAEEVRSGKLSAEDAEHIYGVVMTHPYHSPEKLLIDFKATQELRRIMMLDAAK